MKKIILYSLATVLVCFLFLGVGFFVLPPKSDQVEIPQGPPGAKKGTIVYVINLNRSPRRLERMIPQVQKLGLPWERIEAVDGKDLTPETLEKKADLKKFEHYIGRMPRLGTFGCSFSHIKVWQAFLASSYEYALILEDDIVFNPGDVSDTIQRLEQIPHLWDLCTFEINGDGAPMTVYRWPNRQRLCLYFQQVDHTGAYLVNREAARKLLERALPIVMPIDRYFNRTWEIPFKFRGIEERLVVQRPGSVINETKRSSSQEAFSLLRWWGKVTYNFKTKLIRLWHGLREYAQAPTPQRYDEN